LSAWNDLLEEFRVLGGTADNIRLDHGQFGRGLFPIEPAKPVVIQIPPNLIVATSDMILAGGVPRVGPKARIGEREKSWLNRYQAEVAWGDGEAGGVRKMFDMAAELPGDLRQELLDQHHCGSWFEEPTADLILERYFQSRHIYHHGKDVVMPLIELINHGDGVRYRGADGIGVTGTFPGEIFVQYSDTDAFGFFLAWGFATPAPLAFSVALGVDNQSAPLKIGQRYAGQSRSERDWIPKIEKKAGKVMIPFLMIGNQRFPRLAKGIFYRAMREGGYSGFEETFDVIQHANRSRFLDLLKAVDGIDVPIARTLRSMAYHQLRAMSFCFGVREI
jgi:hypothetical protein